MGDTCQQVGPDGEMSDCLIHPIPIMVLKYKPQPKACKFLSFDVSLQEEHLIGAKTLLSKAYAVQMKANLLC